MQAAVSGYRKVGMDASEETLRKIRKISFWLSVAFAGYLLIFTNHPLIVSATLLLSFLSFVQLILAFGKKIPIREIILFLMVVQLLYTPYLDYTILLPHRMSSMAIGEEEYFEYALPAVLAFFIGMNLRLSGKREFYYQDLYTVSAEDKKRYEKVGIRMVVIGYFFFLLGNIFDVEGLNFIIVVLQLFRFVGIFYLWFARSRFTLLVLLAVLVPVIFITVRGSIFIDLVVWLFFLYSFAAIHFKLKPIVSLSLILAVTAFLVILQTVKMKYRSIAWKSTNIEMEDEGVALFGRILSNQMSDINEKSSFLMQQAMIRRMNQGWIVSHVMKKYPANTIIGHKNYIYPEVAGVLLPRFVYPDKPVAGSNAKFRYMTGLPLVTSVSMNVGVLGDGYGNFGYWGGIFFCFVFGLFMNIGLTFFFSKARKYTSLIFWLPVIFFYSMRAGNEFYIIANWIVKVTIVVYLYFAISKRIFGKYI